MNKFLLLFICCLCSIQSIAQPPYYNRNENKVWALSGNYGLDFSNGNPVPVTTSLNVNEGSVTVCNANGQLLFYATADTVWNRNHQLMPNGYGLSQFSNGNGGSSTTQGAVVAQPYYGSNLYYVFTLEEFGIGNRSRLFYSVVDMSLNGGLGNVTAAKNILLDSLLSEKLVTAYGGVCGGTWILAHSKLNATFKAYRLTDTLNPNPVISNVGDTVGAEDYSLGVMKMSQDQQHIVLCSHFGNKLELFDFDSATGTVSNGRVIDTARYFYGASFSAGHMLYCMTIDQAGDSIRILQYDCSYTDAADIQNSRQVLQSYDATIPIYTDLKLGPDGKIYLRGLVGSQSSIDRIEQPEVPGPGCQYTSGFLLRSGVDYSMGMPNDNVTPYCNLSVSNTAPLQQMNVYPNPSTGIITFPPLADEHQCHIEISNAVGQVVLRSNYRHMIDLSEFGKGVYFYKVTGIQHNYSGKLLLE